MTKCLDWSKLKENADKINVIEKLKHCGIGRKCWKPAISHFPTMFSKGFFLVVIESLDCVVKSESEFVKESPVFTFSQITTFRLFPTETCQMTISNLLTMAD